MFMIITYPWPVPSANLDPAGLRSAAAASRPDTAAETRTFHTSRVEETFGTSRAEETLRPSHVAELVGWTRWERLRLLWYRVRIATVAGGGASRRGRKPRLRLP